MAPIAKIFYNLPELSDDFRRLLKDLMESAPQEPIPTQVRVAAQLTDTPINEGLRRMAEYADIDTRVTSLPVGRAGTNIFEGAQTNPRKAERIERLQRRLGRRLTPEERLKMGDSSVPVWESSDGYNQYSRMSYDMLPESRSTQAYRSSAMNALESASKRKSTRRNKAALSDISYASDYRKQAQRRMALEYLLGELL